jgi:hypothetical protein
MIQYPKPENTIEHSMSFMMINDSKKNISKKQVSEYKKTPTEALSLNKPNS